MNCIYCQNYEISQQGRGKEITIEELANIFLIQQEKGVENVNLVTPTSYVPQIIEAIKIARKKGFKLPIVYNTNGYENVETLKLLEGYIDVYLPDFKYYSSEISFKFSKAKDYFDVASKAIKKMSCLKNNVFVNGQMVEGVLIRHLVLPGFKDDSMKILDFIHDKIDNPYISLMSQFTPTKGDIKRKLYPLEYKIVLSYVDKLGLKNGYIQEFVSASDDFIPEF